MVTVAPKVILVGCALVRISLAKNEGFDTLVDAARKAGAIGAKMSGTGRGGLMLALTPTEESQNAVAAALEKIAPQVWKTSFQ